MKVAVAMSGGVDSSVAAAIMCDKYGKDNVFGVTAKLFCYSEGEPREKACCSLEAIDDAKAVCTKLGIAHYVLNEETSFQEAVINDFISAYKHGQTPIPCIPCNSRVKFGTLLDKVTDLGAEKMVTGHYARTNEVPAIDNADTKYKLLTGVDSAKDQSYFLYGLTQKQLSRTDFPLGGMKKTEVRKLAKGYNLKTAEKKESQGVCFVTEERVADYLARKIETKKGNIVSVKGDVVGRHEGYIFYTVGQRKRIGGGHAEPMFVVRVDPLKNEVVIGNKDDLYQSGLTFFAANWIMGTEPNFPLKCTAKIRYNMEAVPCEVTLQKSKYTTHYRANFATPQRAITPGQSIVLYGGEEVIGGGIIISGE